MAPQESGFFNLDNATLPTETNNFTPKIEAMSPEKQTKDIKERTRPVTTAPMNSPRWQQLKNDCSNVLKGICDKSDNNGNIQTRRIWMGTSLK